MKKFKEGDRIRLTEDIGVARRGAMARVSERAYYGKSWISGEPFLDVVWVRDELSNHQMDGGYHDYSFELVKPAAETRPAIVAKLIGGQPAPAPRPFIHEGREAATTEAERLATANPGISFGVFELVARSSAPAPVAATETL